MKPIYGFDDTYQLARWQAADDLPPILRPPTYRMQPARPQAAARSHAALMLGLAAVVAAAWAVGRRR